jgi:predicted phosphodiesterase
MPKEYDGLLFIGDTHLCSRAPGGRTDDYPQQILAKVEWCLAFAREERLLPCLLGDVFHSSRERQLWFIAEVSRVLRDTEVLAIWGNHDNNQDSLSEDCAFHLLVQSGLLREVTWDRPWEGSIRGRKVQVAGLSYGKFLPISGGQQFASATTFLMTHHDIPEFGGQNILQIQQIDGVDVVVNGHLHRPCEPIKSRKTEWFNPGSLARVSRAERDAPHVLRFDFDVAPYRWSLIEVPCKPYAEVFKERTALTEEELDEARARSIRGLSQIRYREGLPGDGLLQFLKENEPAFDSDVNQKLRHLAEKVIQR